MPMNIPQLAQRFEYVELKVDRASDPSGNQGIIRRAGSSLAAPEAIRGDYSRLLEELGASGWELKATRTDTNGNQVLIFARTIR